VLASERWLGPSRFIGGTADGSRGQVKAQFRVCSKVPCGTTVCGRRRSAGEVQWLVVVLFPNSLSATPLPSCSTHVMRWQHPSIPSSPISLGTPSSSSSTALGPHPSYSHCIRLRAGSVYNPAACVVCFRDVSAITSQLRPHAFLAFLYWTPPSLVVSSRQSADRPMLRIALPKIPSTSWPGQTRAVVSTSKGRPP
jgi:hypothetical protein